MRLRFRSRLKGIVVPAVAALFLGLSMAACSSSSEGEEGAPSAEMVDEKNSANADPLANNTNAEGGGEVAEGEAGAEGNDSENGAAAGNEELSNLVADGSENATTGESPAMNPALNSNVGNDPFANPANQGAANAAAGVPLPNGETNAADPFANGNTVADPAANATQTDPALAAPTDGTNPAAPAGENTIMAQEAPANAAPADAIPSTNVPAWNAPANAANEAGAANANAAVASENVAENNANAENENNANSNVVSSGGGAPAVGYVPEVGSRMAYFVSQGDTLGSIAQKVYGNKSRWKELATANNLANPNKIYPGDVVFYTLDDASKAFADKYEGAPRQTVTVNPGETLSGIAARLYGYPGAWRTLWKENPALKNPDRISAGMVLSYRSFANVAENDVNVEQEEVTQDDEQVEVTSVEIAGSEMLE